MFTLEFLPFPWKEKMPHQLLFEFNSLHFPFSPEIVQYEHRQGQCSRNNGFFYLHHLLGLLALEEMDMTLGHRLLCETFL